LIQQLGLFKTEHATTIIQKTHHMVTRAKLGISKPKIYSISASDIDPTNLKEALSNPAWLMP